MDYPGNNDALEHKLKEEEKKLLEPG